MKTNLRVMLLSAGLMSLVLCAGCDQQSAKALEVPAKADATTPVVATADEPKTADAKPAEPAPTPPTPLEAPAAPGAAGTNFVQNPVPPDQLKEHLHRLVPKEVAKLEVPAKPRTVMAQEQLANAQEDFRRQRFADCLDKCEQLTGQFADLPESRVASTLGTLIKSDPERLTVACEQFNERTATLYLTLAETWMQKGRTKEAIACYEKVTRLAPTSRPAETAQARLTSLQSGKVPAMTTGFEKNK